MYNEDLRFDEWNKAKKEINKKSIQSSHIKIGYIYWIKIGKNIGNEVFGKGKDFARPVLVMNVFYNGLFLGVPLSSKTHNKSGKLYYKFKDNKGNLQTALLTQLRIFDSKRVKTQLSSVKISDFEILKDKLKNRIIG